MKAIIIAAVLFCAALIGGGIYLASRPSTPQSTARLIPLDPSYQQRVQQGYWVRGNTTNPKVTILEYGDFQCIYCGALYPILEQSIAKHADLVQFEFRNYPIPSAHNKAILAAEVAEAAGRQGKFWDMYNKLYSTQNAWEDDLVSQFQNRANGYAQDLGLNMDQFKRDLNDPSLKDEIDKDQAAGNALPLVGTPTLVVNGKKVDTPTTVEQFDQLIEQNEH